MAKLILDESLLYCGVPEKYDSRYAENIKKSISDTLKKADFDTEIVYVGEGRSVETSKKYGSSTFCRDLSESGHVSQYRNIVMDCSRDFYNNKRAFKECISEGVDRTLRGSCESDILPPIGTRDSDIRGWADKNKFFIISFDKDRELESDVTDRIAVQRTSDIYARIIRPCDGTAMGKHIANRILSVVHGLYI